LSYAHEDVDRVEALKGALEAAGLEVWFDKGTLRPGDPFWSRIKNGIESCALFVPVISRHTLTLDKRGFFVEWNYAVREVLPQVAPGLTFIVPVAIDAVSASDPQVPVPDEFRRLHWAQLPGGRATPEFVADLRQHFRRYQKAA